MKELWEALAPGVKSLIIVVALMMLIQKLFSFMGFGSSFFVAVAITALFIPALASSLVEIWTNAKVVLVKLFDKPKGNNTKDE